MTASSHPTFSANNDPLLLPRGLVLIVWLLTLVALLKLGDYFLDDNYSLCGPWGCGPSTGSILAVQLAWTVALLPPLWIVAALLGNATRQRYFALGLLALGLVGLAFNGLWQRFVWLPEVGPWGQPYLWQRIGYTVLTWVEYPMLQLVLAGLLLTIATTRFTAASQPSM